MRGLLGKRIVKIHREFSLIVQKSAGAYIHVRTLVKNDEKPGLTGRRTCYHCLFPLAKSENPQFMGPEEGTQKDGVLITQIINCRAPLLSCLTNLKSKPGKKTSFPSNLYRCTHTQAISGGAVIKIYF